MLLQDYQRKRNFKKTAEPSGKNEANTSHEQSIFVVQKHDASHLHYDLRLEVDGVLKSWAVPKGPSLDPSQKRLAMMVEDHPYSYRNFEGTIPEGSYGAGEVIVWDYGTYTVDQMDKDEREAYMRTGIKHGKITFELHGQKLNGSFALVKMHGTEDNAWLLIKHHDEFVTDEDNFSPTSVLSDAELTRDAAKGASNKKVTIPTAKKSSTKAKLPAFFPPMLATLIDEPFDNSGWIFEKKLDGYRTLAFINDGKVELYSRNEQLLNRKFPSVVTTLEKLPLQAILDGEVVGINADGKIDFQILQNSGRHQDQLYYYVFDILFLEGTDLKSFPLIDRKKLLQKVVEHLPNVQYVEHSTGGKKLYEQAKKENLEGIVAKKIDSRYQPNVRSENWLKIKITQQQEAIICGYTPPQGSRKHFGSLLLGVYQDGVLHYIGHTGTGFPIQRLTELKAELDKRVISHSPFSDAHAPAKDVTWVKPELVCEVKYAQWTNDNILRQAVFQRLRSDKDPKEVVIEAPKKTRRTLEHQKVRQEREEVKFTHPEKVYWPKLGYTKKDMLDYYEQVASVMLPYLQHRPESLNRFPNGIDGESFFQKDITFEVPDFVELVTINSDDAGDIRYLVCNNTETLLFMANLGCIEINPWNSRVESLDCPDYFVMDLDPLDVPFSAVVETALGVKSVLDSADITSFCKTSGKKGMHIFIPLHGQYETDIAATFAKLVASLVHAKLPDLTSLERSPQHRHSRVYIDFLQNRKGQTIAAPYSLRPTPEATASTPLLWEEVNEKLDPKNFTIESLLKRVQKKGDVWEGMLREKNNLRAALKKLQSLATDGPGR